MKNTLVLSIFISLLFIKNTYAAILQKEGNLYGSLFYDYGILNDLTVSIKDTDYLTKVINDTIIPGDNIKDSVLGFGIEFGYKAGEIFSFGIMIDHSNHEIFRTKEKTDNDFNFSDSDDNTDTIEEFTGYALITSKDVSDPSVPDEKKFEDSITYISNVSNSSINIVSDLIFDIDKYNISPFIGLGFGLNYYNITFNNINYSSEDKNGTNFTKNNGWANNLLFRTGIAYNFNKTVSTYVSIIGKYTFGKNLQGLNYVEHYSRTYDENNNLQEGDPHLINTSKDNRGVVYDNLSYSIRIGLMFNI